MVDSENTLVGRSLTNMNSYGLNGHQRMPQCQIVGDKKYCHKKAEKKLTKEQIYEHLKMEIVSFLLCVSF